MGDWLAVMMYETIRGLLRQDESSPLDYGTLTVRRLDVHTVELSNGETLRAREWHIAGWHAYDDGPAVLLTCDGCRWEFIAPVAEWLALPIGRMS